MSNYSEAYSVLKNYFKAKTPFIILDSFELQRVKKMCTLVAGSVGMQTKFYSEINGFVDLKTNSQEKKTDDPLIQMVEMLNSTTNTAFILYDLKYMSNDNAYSRQLLSLTHLAKEKKCVIVLVTGDDVWLRLSGNGVHIKLDLPDLEERREFVTNFIELNKKNQRIKPSTEDIFKISAILGGFSEHQMEMVLCSAMVSENGLTLDTINELAKNKERIYGKISSITNINIPKDVYVSGLNNLKTWLNEKKKVFFASTQELEKRHLSSPKGILLCGVPGCGKSLSAKMIAKEWQLPLYRFDIDCVLNKYVGESEKNMRIALEYIDNVSPCILWIDEIEKVMNVSTDGNETSKRILGQFLYWLQESSSRVFLVATANQIEMLPAELFRSGRFSEKFFLDLPGFEDRKSAIKLYSRICLLSDLEESFVDELANISNGFSFADIELAIKNMAEYMLINNIQNVQKERLTQYFDNLVSTYNANKENIEKSRNWSKNGAISAS